MPSREVFEKCTKSVLYCISLWGALVEFSSSSVIFLHKIPLLYMREHGSVLCCRPGQCRLKGTAWKNIITTWHASGPAPSNILDATDYKPISALVRGVLCPVPCATRLRLEVGRHLATCAVARVCSVHAIAPVLSCRCVTFSVSPFRKILSFVSWGRMSFNVVFQLQ